MKDRMCNFPSVPDKDELSVEVDLVETNLIETGAVTSSADEVDEKTLEASESLQDIRKGSSSAVGDGLQSALHGSEKHRKRKEKLRKRRA